MMLIYVNEMDYSYYKTTRVIFCIKETKFLTIFLFSPETSQILSVY